MSQQINRPVYNLGDATMSAWIYNFTKNQPQPQPQPPQNEDITFYYKLQNPDETNNATETKFVCDPLVGPYRGIENRFMTNETYSTYNTNILTFIGYRTPGATIGGVSIPPLYNETVDILVVPYTENYIQASANYIDSGEGFETTTPFIKYTVTAATGIFKGYTTMTIFFFNDTPGKQRIIKITK